MRRLDLFFAWIRWAAVHRWFWLGAPLLFYTWTMNGPFIADDLHLLLKAERYQRGESQAPDLYRFAKSDQEWNALRDRGTCPWWVETGRLDFFRPVSEWSFYTGVRAFGRNPLGHRLLSMAVFACVLMAVHWMISLASEDRVRAGVATFFFGISQTAAPPVTWICNRQDLLVILGAALAGGAYWSAWRTPKVWQLPLASAGCVFALLSKEVAIAFCAVLIGHEIIVRFSSTHRPARPAPALIAGLVGFISLCYFGYYCYSRPWIFDIGGTEGGRSQLGSNWTLSLLLYSAVWTIGLPIDVLMMATPTQRLIVAMIAGFMTIVVIRYLIRSSRGDRAAIFFALWAILFMLPGLRALTTSTRTLCTATVGWTYLLAGLIVPTREEDVILPRPLRHWFYAANGVISVGCSIGTILFMTRAEEQAQADMRRMVANCAPPLTDGHALIAAHAASSAEYLCAGDRLEYLTGLRDVSFTYLLPSGVDSIAEVQDDHTLLMRAKGTSLLGSSLQQLTLPRDYKPYVGQTFHLSEFTAEITKLRDEHFVEALRFRFKEPLLSKRLHFDPPDLGALTKTNDARQFAQRGGL